MKKSVLFVDDEPLVLSGLRRMLRSQSADWDMEFVTSGTQALERMAQAPVDVIVTDMQMPGMSGADLLKEVARRHPLTVRILLSGQADQDLILQSVNYTHLFLSKPCDSGAIKSAVQRVCSLDYSADAGRLKQVVARMRRLPSLPALYLQIVEELNRPSATIEHIGEIVGQDMAMTAQFLRLVNSAYFGLARAVSSPAEAATYLGLDIIKALVLSIHAFSQFEDVAAAGFNLDALMYHSLRTAGRAREIAKLENAAPRIANDCFVGGMLHDIGKLLLAANCPQDYERVVRLMDQGGSTCCAAEQEIFGVNHANVGGYLLGLWGLPVSVVEAIALHHCPQQTMNPVFGALAAVHAANVFEHEPAARSCDTPEDALHGPYLEALGLAHRVPVWRQACQTAETPTVLV